MKTTNLHIRLTEKQKEKIKKEADKKNITMTEHIVNLSEGRK